jgi:DNA protecting protein DprA
MCRELIYRIALTQIPHIGCVHARLLLQQFHTAEAVFKAPLRHLESMEGIGTVRARSIKNFSQFQLAEKEIAFIEKYHITPLFITDAAYPQRLLHCYDPPTLLYYRGKANLNASRVVAIIGTRSNTPYGAQVTEKLVKELAAYDVLVVSGLAFGIDAIAHKTAINNNVPTVGVLAHGLNAMYPAQHSRLARDMVNAGGGLLTEFDHTVQADRHNFPTRNRVVAGISDAVMVVESGLAGGSIITAELANGYNKDVFAFPGRVSDAQSAGCNDLIKNNKAVLITGAEELAAVMGWTCTARPTISPQKDLFVELDERQQVIVQLLRNRDMVHIDELHQRSGLSQSVVAATMVQLELHNVVRSLPGRMYRLNN